MCFRWRHDNCGLVCLCGTFVNENLVPIFSLVGKEMIEGVKNLNKAALYGSNSQFHCSNWF